MNYIGRIQPPAQAHLDDRGINFTLLKIHKRQGGGDLEGSELRDGGNVRLNSLHHFNKVVMGDELAIDLDAFGVVIQMGEVYRPTL